MSRKPVIAALMLGTSLAGGYAAFSHHFDTAEAAVREAPITLPAVEVVAAISRSVAEWDQYPARFEATDFVEISSRVSGHLTEVHFKPGQIVQAGQALFTIDQRPFRAALKLAEAEVQQALARVVLAEQERTRTQALVAKGHVAQAQADAVAAEMQAAHASLAAAEAQVEEAQLDLDYTVIRAPISGRIDETRIDLGSLVRGVDTGADVLTDIVALDPIHITFDVDQAAVLRYQRLAREGVRQTSREVANPVQVALPDGNYELSGVMDFVSNRVDRSAGTIRVKALIPNPTLMLTPGMFARARLLSRPEVETILIPDEAVSTEQVGRVVKIVGEGNRVETRPVEIGPLIDGLRVVRAGLRKGEQVIVAGGHRARAGEAVNPTEKPAATALVAASR